MRDVLTVGAWVRPSTKSGNGAAKMDARRRRWLGAAAVVPTLLAPLAARAADVMLVADDANNATATSFNAAGNWSNLAAPAPGMTYGTGPFVIRTPNNSTSYTFAGDSLSIDAGSRFLMKGTGGQVATVNLILNGGYADYANSADSFTQTLAGTVAVNAASAIGALVIETLVVNSTVSGSATLAFGGAGLNLGGDTGNVVIAQDNAGFTGGIVVAGGSVLLGATNGGGTGTFASAASFTLTGGSLVLNNVGAATLSNNNDRLADGTAVGLNGGFLVLRGSDFTGTNTAETVGALAGTGGGGATVTFGGANAATLTAASLTHATGNGTFLVNGVGLGKDSASTASVGRFLVTAAPTLVGATAALDTGINAGAKNTQIVPFLVGEATATTGGLGTATGVANTFVTYNPTTGFRPLNPTDEFTASAIVAGTNTRIAAATTAATAAVNSLVIAGADLTVTDGQTLTNTSGATLFTSTNAIKPSATTGALAFGTAEAVVTVNSGITGTISAVLTGSGGLTKGGAGALTLSGANTAFTGGVRLAQGTLNINSAAALGAATSSLTIAGGTTINSNGAAGVTVAPAVPLTLNGDFTFTGSQGLSFGAGAVSLGTAPGTTRTVTVSANTLTLNGAISGGTTAVNLTKLGGGVLQLQSTGSTYSGKTTIGAGTIQVPTLSNLGVAGSLGQPTTVANGTIDLGSGTTAGILLFNGTAAASTDRVINLAGTTGGGQLTQSGTTGLLRFTNFGVTGVGAKTLTLAGSTTGTGELAGSVVNSSNGATALTKTGTGLWKLSGTANAYAGATTISGGTLLFPLASSASPASAVTVATGGILAVNAGGAGEVTNGSAGAGTIGGILGGTFGNGVTYSAGSAFGVDTTNAGGSLTYATAIGDSGTNARGIAKLGAGTLVLSADNTYTGPTYVDGGTLTFSADQTTAKGALVFGVVTSPTFASTAAPAAGPTLNLSAASATFTTAAVNTASSSTTTNPAVITIGAGKTLTLTGGLTVGTPTANTTLATTRTNLTVNGAGSLSVTGGTVQFGAAQTTTNAANNSSATVDLTALGSFSGTGLTAFNVGQGSTNDAAVSLSNTANTVVATTLNVANSAGNNAGLLASNLILGTGTNAFNVDAVNIGTSKGIGTVKFAANSGPGTLTLAGRTAAGVAIVVGSKQGQAGTSAAPAGTLDLTGHVATITATTVNVGVESGTPNGTTSGTTTGTISFGGGTFTADALSLGQKTAASTITAATNGTLNVSGGAVTINPGGSVTLGTNNSAATIVGSVTGTLNITGGTFTSNADVLDGGGANTAVGPTSVLTVGGTGTLDMKGRNIGSAALPIDTLTFTAGGVIRNLGTLSQTLTQNGAASILDVLSNNTAINGGYTVTSGTTSVKPGQSLAVGGALNLSGTTDTLLINDVTGTALNGTSYTLATFGSLTSSAHYDAVKYFNGVSTLTLTDAAATTVGGLPNGYVLAYDAGSLTLSQVPEPTGLLPLAGGLLLGLRRRRRRGN
jgi:autotransporter-associated beta strand protein